MAQHHIPSHGGHDHPHGSNCGTRRSRTVTTPTTSTMAISTAGTTTTSTSRPLTAITPTTWWRDIRITRTAGIAMTTGR